MSINDLVAFATGVRFAIDTIEMIEIDDKVAARTGIASGEQWLAVRGFRHTDRQCELPVRTEVYITRESRPSAGYCSATAGRSST